MQPLHDLMKGESRRWMHGLYRLRREGLELHGDDAVMARIIDDHPEYHDLLALAEPPEDDVSPRYGGVNPYLHLNVHLAVENQLESGEPPAVRDALARMTRRGEPVHDAVHRIGNELIVEIYDTLKQKEPFDGERYVARLAAL